ncbi:MAG TPA: intradiol ring-cleavage dioxygenase [Methylomirabilota bacterium]|nr:intradiol ring-cleavage dioxygenase [Methylomirabilota bacterium]
MKRSAVLSGLLMALALGSSGAAAQPKCAPTPRDAEGPFYKAGAPLREATGKGLVVTGVVRSAADCAPIKGARVEWWQANPKGEYDDAHRGSLVAGENGAYRFETDFPPPYFGRPSHIHFKVQAKGHRPLTTQLYPKAGQSEVAFDLVVVKE